MRTTLDLDEHLMAEALKQTGAKSKTDVIEMGLRALIEKAARKELKALFGRRPGIESVKRQR